jgi:hypothetical protein
LENKVTGEQLYGCLYLPYKVFHKIDLKTLRDKYHTPHIQLYLKMSKTSTSNSSATSTATSTVKKVIEFADWNPKLHKYMAPKVNDKGGKSITLISKQTNRALHLNTPLMMTWGIADFCDEHGNSDGKYKISINFPNEEYKTNDTDLLLKKMIEFQEQVLDDAVENSEIWWGEKMSRELVKHTFFPFLKYKKNKDTKKFDYTSAPSIQAKVPFYDGKRWDVELYDTNYNLIFPCENPDLTPVDFVPKMSKVACTIQCTGIWIGGKGWGLTWKLVQCLVKPRENETIKGLCQIKLSDTDRLNMEKTNPKEYEDFENEEVPETSVAAAVSATAVADSDDEESAPAPPVKVAVAPEPKPVAAAPAPEVQKKKVIVKKKVTA